MYLCMYTHVPFFHKIYLLCKNNISLIIYLIDKSSNSNKTNSKLRNYIGWDILNWVRKHFYASIKISSSCSFKVLTLAKVWLPTMIWLEWNEWVNHLWWRIWLGREDVFCISDPFNTTGISWKAHQFSDWPFDV